MGMVIMQRVTLGEFLEHARSYERMPIPVDPRLRRGVWISKAITVGTAVLYSYLPAGESIRHSVFFLWKISWSVMLWDLVAGFRNGLLGICVAALCLSIILLVSTRGYYVGEVALHWLIFCLVLFGIVNALIAAMLLIPIIVNSFIWAVVLLFAGFVGGMLLLLGFNRIFRSQ